MSLLRTPMKSPPRKSSRLQNQEKMESVKPKNIQSEQIKGRKKNITTNLNENVMDNLKQSNNFCHLCLDEIEARDKFVSCISCEKIFHVECAGVNRVLYKQELTKSTWICSLNCITPNSEHSDLPKSNDINKDVISLKICELENEIIMLSEFQKSLIQKYEELVEFNNNIKELLKSTNESKEQPTAELNNFSEIDKLKFELNQLQQNNIRKNIIIKGININKGDNLLLIFMKIVKFLDSNIQEMEVENIFVKFGSREANCSSLFVKFVNYNAKKLFINSRKGKIITPVDIEVSGKKYIIIEDQLTKENTNLLRDSRNILKNHDFKFIWILNGKICGKFDEKSKYFIIHSLKHLREIENSIIKNR